MSSVHVWNTFFCLHICTFLTLTEAELKAPVEVPMKTLKVDGSRCLPGKPARNSRKFPGGVYWNRYLKWKQLNHCAAPVNRRRDNQPTMENIFTAFFSDVSAVCGHEATLHANFMHHLLADGAPYTALMREHRMGGRRIDLVLSAVRHDGTWTACASPTTAFEFKGGAYGTRNALRDVIDADGYCPDLDRLVALRDEGLECWFVCSDMAELGISLSPGVQLQVATQCARRGIHFAYHAQGNDRCLIARAGRPLQRPKLQATAPAVAPHARWQDSLPLLAGMLSHSGFTEDTAAGVVYHALQRSGFNARQVSLETYFKCARARGRMQQRPDICVFGDRVGGRFNLYRAGDPARPNDGIKIGDLRALIEIKGSDRTARSGERSFASQVSKDIDRLGLWRARFEASGYLPALEAARPDYVMIAIDNRKVPLPSGLLQDLVFQADRQAVVFHYLRIAP